MQQPPHRSLGDRAVVSLGILAIGLLVIALSIRLGGLIRGGAWGGFLAVLVCGAIGLLAMLMMRNPAFRLPVRASITGALAATLSLGSLVYIAYQIALAREPDGPTCGGYSFPRRVPEDLVLRTFDGQTTAFSDYAGSAVVVNFWASWCRPCRAEAADLERVWREYQNEGVAFLGVNYADTDAQAQTFLDEFEITYPIFPDIRSRVSEAFGVQGVPETFLVGPDGTIAHVVCGPTSYEQVVSLLATLR